MVALDVLLNILFREVDFVDESGVCLVAMSFCVEEEGLGLEGLEGLERLVSHSSIRATTPR